ncbi:MAG: CHAT domain-containing tetratricopeptide repeat protein, partial [Pseudomonadota bacterium]
TFHFEGRRYEKAIPLANEAFKVAPDLLAAVADESARLFFTAAETEWEANNREIAIALGKTAVRIKQQYGKTADPAALRYLWWLHFTAMQTDSHQAANHYLKQWLELGDLSDDQRTYVNMMAEGMNRYTAASSVKQRVDLQMETAELALTFAEALEDRADPRLAVALKNLGRAHWGVADFEKSKAILLDALEVLDALTGENDPLIVQERFLIYSDLSAVLYLTEDLDLAEQYRARAEAIRSEIPETLQFSPIEQAIEYKNRADILLARGDMETALNVIDAALALWARVENERDLKWNDHTLRAQILEAKATALSRLLRNEEARTIASQALELAKDHYPETHVELARRYNNHADLLASMGDLEEAVSSFGAAVEVYEKAVPADFPDLASQREIYALTSLVLGDENTALSELSEAYKAWLSPSNRTQLPNFDTNILPKAWSDLALRDPPQVEAAMIASQWGNSTSASRSLAKVAERLQNQGGKLARLIRTRQDLSAELDVKNTTLLAATSSPQTNGSTVDELRIDIRTLKDALEDTDQALAEAGTETIGLGVNAMPGIARIQKNLAPDEVLVTFGLPGMRPEVFPQVAKTSNFVIAISKSDTTFGWVKLATGREVADAVASWRCELAATDKHCQAQRVAGLSTRGSFPVERLDGTSNPQGPDLARGFALYDALFADVDAFIKDSKHLIIVPPSRLASLPFHTLVTDFDTEQDVSPNSVNWLIRRQAVSVMPSILGFVTVRENLTTRQRRTSFFGVGDPVIGTANEVDCRRIVDIAQRAAPANLNPFSDSSDGAQLADVNLVRSLPRLPDSRCELEAISSALGGSTNELLLGETATETAVKDLSERGDLANFSVIAFASHGLIAGEAGAVEPALVLTPPLTATVKDDGLLTASEIATLRLDADFVVLSACSTAAGSNPDAEGLSGLAQAFLYAGARSLLVTHWPVYSDAAVRMTTEMFRVMADEPKIRRAEAVRLAMLAMIDDAHADSRVADPSYWAPFMVVGEGGSI